MVMEGAASSDLAVENMANLMIWSRVSSGLLLYGMVTYS